MADFYYRETAGRETTDLVLPVGSDKEKCRGRAHIGWACWREKGHDGPHQAGVSDTQYVAEWAEKSECYEVFGYGSKILMNDEQPRPSDRCNNPKDNWTCTRRKGHDGLCKGGRSDGTMAAQWYDPYVSATRPNVFEEPNPEEDDDDYDDYGYDEDDDEEDEPSEADLFVYDLLNP